jgi:hypothetical protein
MELPQPQLALDPRVTKLYDSSPATILFLGYPLREELNDSGFEVVH